MPHDNFGEGPGGCVTFLNMALLVVCVVLLFMTMMGVASCLLARY